MKRHGKFSPTYARQAPPRSLSLLPGADSLNYVQSGCCPVSCRNALIQGDFCCQTERRYTTLANRSVMLPLAVFPARNSVL